MFSKTSVKTRLILINLKVWSTQYGHITSQFCLDCATNRPTGKKLSQLDILLSSLLHFFLTISVTRCFFLKNKLRVSKGINTILIIGSILHKTSSHLLSAANPLLLRSARVLVSLVYLQPNHGNTPLNDAFEKVTLFLNRHWYTLSLFLAYYHLNFFPSFSSLDFELYLLPAP